MKVLRYIAAILLGLGVVVALALAGFLGGLSLGLQYTDFPIIEAYGGLSCGGLVGVIVAMFLVKRIWPHKKEQDSLIREMPPSHPVQRRFSLFERLIGVITLKAPVYRQIAEDESTTQTAGVIVAIMTFLSGFVSGVVNVSIIVSSKFMWVSILVITSVIFGLVGWYFSSWALARVANAFGGKTNTGEMLRVTGFVQFFRILDLLSLLNLINIAFAAFLWPVGWVALVLSVIGYTIGVRESAEVATNKALVTAIIGAIVNFIIVAVGTLIVSLAMVLALAK